MAKLYNLARMTTATTGTGTITLGSAVTGFLTFGTAGVGDGETVTYAIQDGSQSEIGRGVYTASGTTLSRASILKSTNGGSTINLSGNAQVFVTAAAEDFARLNNTLGNYAVTLAAGTNVTANRTLTLTTGDADRTLNISAGSVTISAFGASLIDDATAVAAQSTLGLREVLTADRTYYVRTDGSDSNTGLANTAGGAFLTIQKAVDVVAALDGSIYNVTINVGGGTFAENVVLKNTVGSGTFSVVGAGSGSTVVTSFTAAVRSNWTVTSLKLTGGTSGFLLLAFAELKFSGVDFGTITVSHIGLRGSNSRIESTGNYTISGGASYHILADGGNCVVFTYGRTVTLTGTPAFGVRFAHFT
jgi:hypothetical protein